MAFGELSEIDRVRWERDVARAENVRLRAQNERLALLLKYADEAVREEYRLRIASAMGRVS